MVVRNGDGDGIGSGNDGNCGAEGSGVGDDVRWSQCRAILWGTATVSLLFFFLLALPTPMVASTTPLQESRGTPLLKFQEDELPREDTMLRYRGHVPEMTRLTVCFRVYLLRARFFSTLISYNMPDGAIELYIGLVHDEQGVMVWCCKGSISFTVRMNVFLRRWISICVALDLEASIWHLVSQSNFQQGALNLSQTSMVRGGGLLVLGQDQDIYDNGYNAFQSFCGYLMDMAIYGDVLSLGELSNYTACDPSSGNTTPQIDFSSLQKDFDILNVELEEDYENNRCETKTNFTAIFTEHRDFDESKLLCNISGGQLVVPMNEAEKWSLFKKFVSNTDSCSTWSIISYWLGVRGQLETQTWLHYVTDAPLTYMDFRTENGLLVERPNICIAFAGSNRTATFKWGKWSAVNCKEKLCSVCHFQDLPILKVRGLCRQSLFDRYYMLTYDNDSVRFEGTHFSRISKHPPEDDQSTDASIFGFWKLERLDQPSVQARMRMQNPTGYPVGLNSWVVENDMCGDTEVLLMLTICKDNQFSCSNGGCVSINQRCDQELDCKDGSDERDCYFIDLPKGYDQSSPPSRTTIDKPIRVEFHIVIQSIRTFQLAQFKFITEVEVSLCWFDDRLRFHHLNYASELNNVNYHQNRPWIPELEFLGDEDTTSDVTERRSYLTIFRRSDPLPDDDRLSSEVEIFEGRHNPLKLLKKLTVSTSCQFNLEGFPFDTQICTLGLLLSGVTKQYVTLVPVRGGVTITGRRRMLEYELTDQAIILHDEGNYSGLSIYLTFSSISSFYITSTYLPTFIIIVIGYVVLYFPIDNFNERIMVGLTGLLVEATFFSQVSSSIPRTAYLKLVDMWFVFCIISLFLVVINVGVIQWLQNDSSFPPPVVVRPANSKWVQEARSRKRRMALKVNSALKVIFPIATFTFLAFYTILAFYHRSGRR